MAVQMTVQTSAQSLSPVRLGFYLIDPINRTVSRFIYFEKDDNNGIHSWGEHIMVDSVIDFNTTCLYAGNNILEFKEHYTPYISEVFDNTGNVVDMSGYKPFRKYGEVALQDKYLEKNGEYYYTVITLVHRKTENAYDSKRVLYRLETEAGIDFAKLKYAGNDCFYDDQGLYRIHENPHNQKQLVKVASGKDCIPVVKQNYCIYNGNVYGIYSENKKATLITVSLDIDSLVEVLGSITDGKTLIRPDRLSCPDTMHINKWKQLTNEEVLEKENNCVYMQHYSYDESSKKGREPVFAPLCATPQGFVTMLKGEPFTNLKYYDKVFIFNSDKKEYEEIDTDEFQLCVKDFYVYRNKLHYCRMPVTDTLDAPNLRYIFTYGGYKWLTDGKHLINLDLRRITDSKGSNAYSYPDISDRHVTFGTVPVADASNLRVIHSDLLFDGVNFYSNKGREIQVIPVKSLGVEVKMIDD